MSLDIAYVLHRRRYRESSLIIDFLTFEQGRIGAVARGALRKNSRTGAILQPLIPLRVAFSGRSELRTLNSAETDGKAPMLDGRSTYSLFYVNELVLRLTAPHDPNEDLFKAYTVVAAGLGRNEALEPLLRRFEKRLLDALGLGLNLATEAHSNVPIAPEGEYHFVHEHGPVVDTHDSSAPRVSGETLLTLAGEGEFTPTALREAKHLMRYVFNHLLDGRALKSRELFEANGG